MKELLKELGFYSNGVNDVGVEEWQADNEEGGITLITDSNLNYLEVYENGEHVEQYEDLHELSSDDLIKAIKNYLV